MKLLSVEIAILTRKELRPDPAHDPIFAIFWMLAIDDEDAENYIISQGVHFDSTRLRGQMNHCCETNSQLISCKDEEDLLEKFAAHVVDADPDVLIGYEIQNSSFGFMFDRAYQRFKMDFPARISRIIEPENRSRWTNDSYSYRHTSLISITGRHVLNIWRVMKNEVTLLDYSFENVIASVLKIR